MTTYWFYHYIDRYIGIGLIITFFLFKKFSEIFKKNKIFTIKKILIIKLSMIGDTILLYPAVKSIKEKFSQVKITMLCSDINLEIVKKWNFIDEVIVFKVNEFLKNPFSIFNLIFKKNRRFDIAIDFEQWFRITAILAFLYAKFKIGFKTQNQFRHYLFDKAILHRRKKHEVECFCELVEVLGIKVEDKQLCLPIDNQTILKMEKLINNYNLEKKQFIIIHPGCGIHGQYRQWDIEKYVEVAEYVVSRYNLNVVLTGSKDDLKIVKKIMKISKVNFINFVGKTTLEELISLVSMAKFVICGNTGVLHIAAAVRTPTIAIHGPTDPAKWGPWGEGHIIVKSNLKCAPCSYLGFEYKCKKRKCLKNITKEDVINSIDYMISSLKLNK
ncbi:MAG: glycosyltransferase family 9 protein [Endomicrobia bacterium]|nr:glycosyltransferase family 9 protein [Endomicrobiia bacterium]